MTLLKRLLREPLVHFLLLGGLLFLFFQWRGSGGPTSSRIVITPGLVEHLASGFGRTWQRPPTDAELKGLIDDYVKEEIATREAVGMGLDRDDTIIRRRLRQKLEFLVEDAASSAPPTDAELEAWLDKHPQSFRAEPQLAFRQVYVEPGAPRRVSRRKTPRSCSPGSATKGPDTTTDGLGDASMLPAEQPLAPLREVEPFLRGGLRAGAADDRAGTVDRSGGVSLRPAPGARPRARRRALRRSSRRFGPWSSARCSRSGGRGTSTPSTSGCSQKYTVTIEKPKAKPPPAAAAGAGGAR